MSLKLQLGLAFEEVMAALPEWVYMAYVTSNTITGYDYKTRQVQGTSLPVTVRGLLLPLEQSNEEVTDGLQKKFYVKSGLFDPSAYTNVSVDGGDYVINRYKDNDVFVKLFLVEV